MALNVDWMWLIIGIALGFFVAPMLVGTLKAKTAKKS